MTGTILHFEHFQAKSWIFRSFQYFASFQHLASKILNFQYLGSQILNFQISNNYPAILFGKPNLDFPYLTSQILNFQIFSIFGIVFQYWKGLESWIFNTSGIPYFQMVNFQYLWSQILNFQFGKPNPGFGNLKFSIFCKPNHKYSILGKTNPKYILEILRFQTLNFQSFNSQILTF